MEGCKVGSSTPLYSQAVCSRGKKPLEVEKDLSGEGKRDNDDTQKQNNRREEEGRKEQTELKTKITVPKRDLIKTEKSKAH